LLDLNSAGRVVVLVGFPVLLLGLLVGHLSRGIVLAMAIFAACAFVEMFSSVAVMDGKLAVTVGIRVVDSSTREPIQGASVALRDLDLDTVHLAFHKGPAQNLPPLASCTTDAQGEASIAVKLPDYQRFGTFYTSERVSCPPSLGLTITERAHHTEKYALAHRFGETFLPKSSGVYRIEIEMNPIAENTTSAGGPNR
jgi:hypothetical protein